MSEIERVSALFDAGRIGPGEQSLVGGDQVVSDSMGRSGSKEEVLRLTNEDRLQSGGGRRKRKSSGTRRRRGGHRFRLNIRATIRLRSRK
jgi:hypothetical protein